MSISFPATESGSTLDRVRAEHDSGDGDSATRAVSLARVEANRRNSRKSTGPRTAAGKRRVSRNAMKHGLCAALSHLPCECDATFHTFVAELEEELQPRTAMQRVLFTEIANLSWRLGRLPEAQSKIFAEEMAKVACGEGEELNPSDVLARRFSEEPGCNGFARIDRYERGMRSQLLRLFRQFDQFKRQRPTTPHDPDEPPCPPEQAWTPHKAQQQRDWFAEQERLAAEGKEPDRDWARLREQHVRREPEDEQPTERPSVPAGTRATKQSQSEPSEKLDSTQRARKSARFARAAVTEQSQCDGPASTVTNPPSV